MPISLSRAAVVLASCAAVAVTTVSPALASGPGQDPVPGAGDHPSGHGHAKVYPTREFADSHRGGAAAAGQAAGSGPLAYGGAVDGIGVTTGAPKTYLVFYGSQWGTSSTGTDGYLHLSGDPQGMAPRVQAVMKGIGTNNETWSGVMTQFCEGVTKGATSCPSTAAHVGYPTGGTLAGVWADPSVAAPSQATGHQLAVEAVAAAGHFGNTTAASNRNAQYVIVSPTGTHPDGFNTVTGNFCAWHDWNGDTTMTGGAATSSYGDIAFTNLPYLTDAGTSCGQSYVNAGTAGTLDGVSIVEGHEYAETITDQNPAGGWTDSTGYENADKCAWVGVGGTGGAQNIAFATGSFPMQATWSNDANGCQISHPIVTNSSGGGGTSCTSPGQKLGNPGFETGTPAPWTASSGVVTNSTGEAAHAGSWKAWLDGYGSSHTDTLSQSVTLPTGCSSYVFSFWLHIDTAETTTATAYDKLTVAVGSTTLATYSNLNAATGYVQRSFNLASYAGQTVTLKLTGVEDTSLQTSFVVDDTAVQVS